MLMRYRHTPPAPAPMPSGLPGLERFLYAEVGLLPNGESLTVNSMLAQQGLDPWAEARALQDLPTGAAMRRLMVLIQAQNPRLCGPEAPAAATARLARLLYLPEQSRRSPAAGVRAKPEKPGQRPLPLGLMIVAALFLAMLALTKQPAAPDTDATAARPAQSTVPPDHAPGAP